MKILIVDDDPKLRGFVAKGLETHGIESASASDGGEALAALDRADEPPDLILLDVMMPGMDGFEVCRQLKNRLETKAIPVIFITAKADQEDIVKGFACGAVDYVTKPFYHAELLARVKVHVEVKMLRGILPICSRCKKIRDDQGLWEQVDEYLARYSDILFSHGICPECMEYMYGGDARFLMHKGTRKE